MMAIIAGTTFNGFFSELTIVRLTSSTTKTGASTSVSNQDKVSTANSEKTVTKFGAAVGIYATELAAIFGSEL